MYLRLPANTAGTYRYLGRAHICNQVIINAYAIGKQLVIQIKCL